jgi:hypothetical protein
MGSDGHEISTLYRYFHFHSTYRSNLNIKNYTEFDTYYMLVVGDDFGNLKFFKYPCITI